MLNAIRSATVIASVLILFSSVIDADAQDRDEFGMGLLIGEPSGLNAQFFWGPRTAVDVTAAWSLSDEWFMTIADFQVYDYIGDAPREWRWYYGLGGYLALPENDDGTLGVRIPLGIKYHFPHSYIDVWAEVAPALELVPETQAAFQGGLGLTFWLK
jgi:hypothetical protein